MSSDMYLMILKVYPTAHSTGAMEVGKINRRGNNLYPTDNNKKCPPLRGTFLINFVGRIKVN